MERLFKVFKRMNAIMGVGALVLFTVAAMSMVGAARAADEGGDNVVAAAPAHQHAPTEAPVMLPEGHALIRCWAFMAAAIATGIGSLAAGYAVGNVGAAAMGAVAEKPELMGKSLIYVALAEGIAIYGLLIAIIVLAKV